MPYSAVSGFDWKGTVFGLLIFNLSIEGQVHNSKRSFPYLKILEVILEIVSWKYYIIIDDIMYY